MTAAPPDPLRRLTARYDRAVFDPARTVRVRLEVRDGETWDALIDGGPVELVAPAGRPDAELRADLPTWSAIAGDLRGGLAAFAAGRLAVRRDLHLGVGFLAATSGATGEGRLAFRTVETARGRISTTQAGAGPVVVAIHGLGATKASLLPTVGALAGRFRVIAPDLPGFGDSDKPIGAAYDAAFFAEGVVALLDALEVDRAHLVGNSLGGRVALEVGLRHPGRVRRLGLLAPSMAWRREPSWARLLRFVPPELGLVQPVPRAIVERLAEAFVPDWAAAGTDEFLRSYLTPAGRAAFYAAARQIYLERPDGPDGFWPRLRELSRPSLFVWGRQDTLVPIAFARHVTEALPVARHLELDCGHVPQLERPVQTHRAIERFLAGDPAGTG